MTADALLPKTTSQYPPYLRKVLASRQFVAPHCGNLAPRSPAPASGRRFPVDRLHAERPGAQRKRLVLAIGRHVEQGSYSEKTVRRAGLPVARPVEHSNRNGTKVAGPADMAKLRLTDHTVTALQCHACAPGASSGKRTIQSGFVGYAPPNWPQRIEKSVFIEQHI